MKYRKGDEEAKTVKAVGAMMDGPVHYPSMLNLDEGDLKAVKNWAVGKTYKVKLKIKQVSSSMDNMPGNDTDKGTVHAKFEVVKAKVEDENPAEDKAEGYKEE